MKKHLFAITALVLFCSFAVNVFVFASETTSLMEPTMIAGKVSAGISHGFKNVQLPSTVFQKPTGANLGTSTIQEKLNPFIMQVNFSTGKLNIISKIDATMQIFDNTASIRYLPGVSLSNKQAVVKTAPLFEIEVSVGDVNVFDLEEEIFLNNPYLLRLTDAQGEFSYEAPFS